MALQQVQDEEACHPGEALFMGLPMAFQRGRLLLLGPPGLPGPEQQLEVWTQRRAAQVQLRPRTNSLRVRGRGGRPPPSLVFALPSFSGLGRGDEPAGGSSFLLLPQGRSQEPPDTLLQPRAAAASQACTGVSP